MVEEFWEKIIRGLCYYSILLNRVIKVYFKDRIILYYYIGRYILMKKNREFRRWFIYVCENLEYYKNKIRFEFY